ncbi:ROK family protein [Nocardia donostiensis]|uniref:Sugar kinase n=1 Tax=Nocardia donostiensis TaxID=1538463 RepID=A0A1W0BP89_9NOCA|nr:ROK family protein [Nocardia donostiensis]ONM47517.1 sugar kinase [Nocardia donostiensis]OQS15140.1 sugar kinase [Nocardia donostiensis]OQS24313.1 sugar kinase [Nocardia donostiensis]
MAVLALDIGATKFAAGRVDSAGRVDRVSRVPVPHTGAWDVCRALLSEVADGDRVTAVGIGSAGPVDVPAGVTCALNIPEWRSGFEIVDAVRELFPAAETRFAIDGACLALAEHRWGALRGTADALAMTVSSGIGGGILAGGRVLMGRTGNAGHIGHIVVPGWDVRCACGGAGCVEAIASGMSSVRWARAQGWTGETGAQLAEAAAAGQPIALAALERAGTALGQAVSSAAALLDIDHVVIGGGFACSGEPLWGPLRASVARHAGLSFLRLLRVAPSELAEGATLAGAGILAVER